MLVASLLCLGVILDKETVRRVGVLPPAPNTAASLFYSVQKKEKKKKKSREEKKYGGGTKKKKVVISVDDKTMPIHRPLAAHERAHNLGG